MCFLIMHSFLSRVQENEWKQQTGFLLCVVQAKRAVFSTMKPCIRLAHQIAGLYELE